SKQRPSIIHYLILLSLLLQNLAINIESSGIEADEYYQLRKLIVRQVRAGCRYGDFRCAASRKSVDSGRNSWKREVPEAFRAADRQTRAVPAGKTTGFSGTPAPQNRTHCVYHVRRWQTVASGQPSLSGRTAADCSTFGEEAGTRGTMNRAVDAA